MNRSTRTPEHLWVVGAAMTVVNLASFTDSQRVDFESFPLWMDAVWAFGVCGGLAGSLLLLARSRHAVTAFAVSLAGLAISTVYEYALADPPEDIWIGSMIGGTVLLWAVAVGLLYYALRMRRRGVLR